MNERIKQLALKAGFDFGRDWQVIGQGEDSLKVFTKLIIQECADHLMSTRGQVLAAIDLKQHFGVEE